MENDIATLKKIGLSDQKAKETIKNAALTNVIKTAVDEAVKCSANLKEVGSLLYYVCSKIKNQIISHLPLLVSYVSSGKLDSNQRIDAALDYLLSHAHGEINLKELEQFCGVGIVVTPEDIEAAVESVILAHKQELLEQRYKFNTGPILFEVKKRLKWADGKDVKNEVDVQILDLLGPKTEEDLKPAPKKQKAVAPKSTKDSSANVEEGSILTVEEVLKKVNFHRPGENHKTEGYVITPRTGQLLKEHLDFTKGQVRTRFPPEPNGILHIGHAKAININFGYAALHKGTCFLRYDDTNPEKEEEKFFRGISDMVHWLGYKPDKVTHTSDYFDELYEMAITLIKKGLAYVCHQKSEDIKGFNPPPSPWKDRPVEESLSLFTKMKSGLFEEGECTLRLKVTLEEGKQDPVAYRIKYLPHPRTGNKWCIYPTYDYAHCLCDSLENITHSLCTKEFQSRRSSYYWLCNALDIYCPVQWEYGRLSMTYTVVSKRKIAKLIESKIVNDWDDPRLFTLTALRRRGVPAEAINRFCAQMGVTGANAVVSPAALDACIRDVLNTQAPRTMVVLEPLKIIISNHNLTELPNTFSVPDFPANPNKFHEVEFRNTLYIEKSDFQEHDEKGYRRLTPHQSVGLRHTGIILSVKKYNLLAKEPFVEVTAEQSTDSNKPKAFIHWVADPVPLQVNLYSSLFAHPNPEDSELFPKGFLSALNTDTLEKCSALADRHLLNAKPFTQFQFERLGYFSVDPDSSASRLIFNRTVELKEDTNKK